MLVRKELAVSEFSICAKKLKDLGDLVIFFFLVRQGLHAFLVVLEFDTWIRLALNLLRWRFTCLCLLVLGLKAQVTMHFLAID